jgi:hypothetical protein
MNDDQTDPPRTMAATPSSIPDKINPITIGAPKAIRDSTSDSMYSARLFEQEWDYYYRHSPRGVRFDQILA